MNAAIQSYTADGSWVALTIRVSGLTEPPAKALACLPTGPTITAINGTTADIAYRWSVGMAPTDPRAAVAAALAQAATDRQMQVNGQAVQLAKAGDAL